MRERDNERAWRQSRQLCLEAEQAALVRARMRIAGRLCKKAHLEQRVLSGTGLKIQVGEDKLNPQDNLETFDSLLFVAQAMDISL